jgi:predicted Zn finger-like uncharacterized protein
MIAACPKCSARYRIDKERLPAEGARLRCSRCEAVFRVSPPAREEPARAAALAQVDPSGAPPPPERDRQRLVLIADPEVDSAKATAQAISSWGLESVLVHDGVEAILTIQRMLPRAVVLDAALPKMFGFQICELMKRNESLRGIQVVLIGAIHDRARYRRPPTEFYGADAYIERPNLPEALRPILTDFGLPSGSSVAEETAPAVAPPEPEAVAAPEPPPLSFSPPEPEPVPNSPPVLRPGFEAFTPASVPPLPGPGAPDSIAPKPVSESGNEPTVEISQPAPPATTPVELPAPPEPAIEDPGPGEAEVQKAERLARIVVSDIVLYNEEKFAAAIQAGNVLEAMEGDMQEGRGLFVQRIESRIRESRDFLAEELLRVAQQRGMK